MKKLALFLLFCSLLSPVFADVVQSAPTGTPMLDVLLIVGFLAIVTLLIIRYIRGRKR